MIDLEEIIQIHEILIEFFGGLKESESYLV